MLQTLARPIVAKPSGLVADPVDVALGARIRVARKLSGFSQEKLAAEIGVTFQQLQKYEKGVNRCGPSRLTAIARSCGRPIEWFYGDAETAAKDGSDAVIFTLVASDPALIRDVAALSMKHRALVKNLVAALAGQERAA
ncbi:helix-turn-helix domain-containing protein [Chenggangzhangella methanolivorans]|uniref:helix-turn-helix domain-containing protein n=1 Tax=Chenggangzhangella methanolivorans TaxID=1437009 RepID=UPI00361E5C0D